jgi:hypothetical protein
MIDAVGRTDWQGLILTLLVPAVIVAGLVDLALQPQWTDSDDWIVGLFVLIPFEFVRVIVMWILRDAYKDYRTPWQAVKFFLLSVAILAVLCLIFALFEIGFRDVFVALADPQTWRYILPPAGIILADGIISLYFFRGDARSQAARLGAVADDAEDWLLFAVSRLPFVVAAAYALLIYLRSRGVAVPAWIPDPSLEAFREICLLWAALYFSGKGMLLAHVHTAHFNRTGRRLLSAGWIQVIVGRGSEEREKKAKAEHRAVAERLAALQGIDAG